MVIGGALTHPMMIAAFNASQQPGAVSEAFLGIPLTWFNYSSSVIPIILAAWVSCWLEKQSTRLLPSSMKNFFAPLICLGVTVPLTFLVIGPARDVAQPAAGQRLPVDLYPSSVACRRGDGRAVAGLRHFRPTLGAGTADD